MCAAMRRSLPVLLLLLLATAWAGEYCEDFENGDLGDFWRQSLADQGGKWEPSSYVELKKTIPDFPEPASGDTVVYLTPNGGTSYVSARLLMNDAYSFPAGSSIYFRYWLRSQYPQSGTLELRQVIGTMEQPSILYSLTDESGPDVDTWKEINITIPEGNEDFKLMIFAACSTEQKDNIAIDDISVYGPTELSQTCGLATTTPEPTTTTPQPTTTTTEPTTTTEQPTTTEPTTTEPTTTVPTIEPTTTEPTTTEPTTTEPTTTIEPTTTEPTTTEPTTTEPTTTELTTTDQTTTLEPSTAPTVTSAPTTTVAPTSETPTSEAPPTSAAPPPSTAEPTGTPEPTSAPVRPDDRRYGSSALLWVVFVVLGTSVVLALVLALTRQRRRRDDQLELLEHQEPGSSGGGSSGWYDYITTDKVKTRLADLMRSLT